MTEDGNPKNRKTFPLKMFLTVLFTTVESGKLPCSLTGEKAKGGMTLPAAWIGERRLKRGNPVLT